MKRSRSDSWFLPSRSSACRDVRDVTSLTIIVVMAPTPAVGSTSDTWKDSVTESARNRDSTANKGVKEKDHSDAEEATSYRVPAYRCWRNKFPDFTSLRSIHRSSVSRTTELSSRHLDEPTYGSSIIQSPDLLLLAYYRRTYMSIYVPRYINTP
ncbi:hypothetical protein KQX54_010886 [Cotesia glomerata]|uniref:Uncharacterized protein n=1 Tax=Cotesia glomerata TaxID=32391 RepID=A0AAV7J4J6_COTGL|nr:hypothetical protein KQX54_010886 [Cotesia glomerata]